MKKEEYPRKFPNCPSYLSKKEPAERSCLGPKKRISTQRSESKWLSKLEAKIAKLANDINIYIYA